MTDFGKIVLLKDEEKLLLTSRKKPISYSQIADKLYRLDLVERNFSYETDEFNQGIPDGTYSISDDGLRYIKYHHLLLRREIFTPIIVSIIANIAIYSLRELLLPVLVNLISGLL